MEKKNTDARGWANPKWNQPKGTLSYNIVQHVKTKDRKTWKEWEKNDTGANNLNDSDYSSETMVIERTDTVFFQVLKEKNYQPRILCPAKISFKIFKRKIKMFLDEGKLGEFVVRHNLKE